MLDATCLLQNILVSKERISHLTGIQTILRPAEILDKIFVTKGGGEMARILAKLLASILAKPLLRHNNPRRSG